MAGEIVVKLTKGNETGISVCVCVCVCVLIPQVAFVGGVLDVVTDVVVHSMGCCAVSRIKNLEGHCKN